MRVPKLLLLSALLTLPAQSKEKMPKEDVISVPAIGEGLCVSNLFQSGMVLQRDKPISIWGWADAGEVVTITFADGKASATAGKGRYWKVELPALPANKKSQSMVIQGKSKKITLENILLGDVWVLGGQSNMEFPLRKVENGDLEIAGANHPQIRVLTIPYKVGPVTPKKSFPLLHEYSSWFSTHFKKGSWDECSPEIASQLSAIGYEFACNIHKVSGVPVGVIDTSRGGTTVETWTALDKLRGMDSEPTKALLAEWDEKVTTFDPKADLVKRIKNAKDYIERMKKKGQAMSQRKATIPTEVEAGPIVNQNHPGGCFGGMIAPLAGLSVKGAIFHQGYNNAFNFQKGIDMYADVFPVLIQSWREAFGDPELPFGILSLCTGGGPQELGNYSEMMFDAGVGLRAVQYQTFLDLYNAGDKNIGFVSTYDLRRTFFHPQVKLPAGRRIARWALATQYGQKLLWKPPVLTGMEVKDGSLLLSSDESLVNPLGGAMQGFAIAGEAREFHPATVTYVVTGKDSRGREQYDKTKLVLTSPMVPKPIHYRYAWSRNPLANVQIIKFQDVPLATQRSDDWTMGFVPLSAAQADTPRDVEPHRGNVIKALRELDRQRKIAEAKQTLETHADPKK